MCVCVCVFVCVFGFTRLLHYDQNTTQSVLFKRRRVAYVSVCFLVASLKSQELLSHPNVYPQRSQLVNDYVGEGYLFAGK